MLSQIALTSSAVRVAWTVWGIFLLAACAVVVHQTDRRPANDAYARGAARWAAGENLYVERGNGFIYLPQSALLYFPFSILPKPAEHALWRVVTIGLFGIGVFRLCRVAAPEASIHFFPLVSAMVLPKTWTCALNGQATPAMAGLSMLALAQIHEQKWWPAAAFLVAALAFKPLALVLLLLLAVLYRPLVLPLGAALLVFVGLPFLAGNPEYVCDQYVGTVAMFKEAAARGLSPEWPQLFSLANLAGISASEEWQTALRIAAALGTLAVCALIRRPDRIRSLSSDLSDQLPGLISIYGMATCYLLLFNPRTENNSYLLLSPAVGIASLHSYFIQRRVWRGALQALAAAALIAGHEICQWTTPRAGFVWVCPLVCLVFAADLIREAVDRSGWRSRTLPGFGATSDAMTS